jgi:hypothetical protein
VGDLFAGLPFGFNSGVNAAFLVDEKGVIHFIPH